MRGYNRRLVRDRLALLLQVHALVGLGEELLGVQPILRIYGLAHAQRENVFVANFFACALRQLPHLFGLACGRFRRKARRNDHEFVAAHARHVVVFAAAYPSTIAQTAAVRGCLPDGRSGR